MSPPVNRCLPLLSLAVLLAFPVLRAADDSPAFIVQNDPIATPAGANARDPRLTRSPDGAVHLTWIETSAGSDRLFLAAFLPAARRWSPAVFVTDEPGDYAVAAGPDHRLALLAISSTRVALFTSPDGGGSWSRSAPGEPSATRAPRAPALQFLSDGRLLAAWIEERPPGAAALLARILAGEHASPAQLVAADVSPGDSPALAAFPDGSALAAYRGFDGAGVQDICTARFDGGAWSRPALLNADAWTPSVPPADGPVLASRGAHLAAAWFTAADGARLNLSVSSSAGGQWLIPNRIDDVAPLGRPALVMLDDGGNLAAWVERDGGGESVWLRRLSPRGTLGVPVRIAQAITGRPRLALVKDGDTTPAQLLLACLQSPSAPADTPLVTRLITLPDAALLAGADACDCDPRPEDQRGYGLQGRIVSLDRAAGIITVAHDAIPGVMKAATTAFKAAPDLLAAAQPGRRVFARTERIGPDWWLFNLRPLAAP